MNKKILSYFIVCDLLLGTSLFAQNKTFIGDTSNVKYEPYPNDDVIDSVVTIKVKKAGNWKEMFSPWIVYFDKKKTSIAYKSYINGDSSVSFDYWRNGKLKKKSIHIDQGSHYLWYYEERYCENGQSASKWFPNKSPNHWIAYYCNGKKRVELNTNEGVLDGVQYYWYENGNIKAIVSYKSFFTGTTTKSYPVGNWKFYRENGKLDSMQVYQDKKLIKTIR